MLTIALLPMKATTSAMVQPPRRTMVEAVQ
jgi:hypothetical protein